jgi:AcrR family transcriptional regulator
MSPTEASGDATTARQTQMKARLVAAAETLLRQGATYPELRVEDLLVTADVARATYYAYFDDKVELLRAWFADVARDAAAAASAWWDLGPPVERDVLRDAVTRLVDSHQPDSPLLPAVYGAGEYDPRVRTDLADALRVSVDGLSGHITRGQAGGWIAPDLGAPQTAGWLMTMAARGRYRLLAPAAASERPALIDAYVTIVWKTLYLRV